MSRFSICIVSIPWKCFGVISKSMESKDSAAQLAHGDFLNPKFFIWVIHDTGYKQWSREEIAQQSTLACKKKIIQCYCVKDSRGRRFRLRGNLHIRQSLDQSGDR